MSRARQGNWALGGCALALLLLALGLLTGNHAGESHGGSTRVILLGVRGLSWQSTLELMEQRRLPTITRLVEGESAKGDLIAPGYGSDDEVLASVVSGRLTFKHGMRTREELDRFDREPGPLRRTVWGWIASRGERVAAIGFPFSGAASSPDAWVVRGGRAGGGLDPHQVSAAALQRQRIAPEDLDASLLGRVAGDAELDEATTAALRDCLAADLSVVALAREISQRDPGRHLFLYLEGLDRWRGLRGGSTAAVAGYYEQLDGMLRSLLEIDTPHTSWLLFSERGNPGGAIRYRPHFPPLKRWPPIGFFMAWGHGVKRSVLPHTLAPVDVAATLAYLSGNPISLATDGIVQLGLLDDGYFARQRQVFAPDG